MLGYRVKELREAKGIKQKELANLATNCAGGRRVAAETLSKIEHGVYSPGAWMIQAIAEALQTTMDYLTGITDNPNRPDADIPPVTTELEPLLVYLNKLPREKRQKVVDSIMSLLDITSLSPTWQDYTREKLPAIRNLRDLMATTGLSAGKLLALMKQGASSAEQHNGTR